MTNGEKIKEIFPSTDSRLDEKTGIMLVKWVDGATKCFKADWWDAEYEEPIKALEQEPRWIPVSERLPKANIHDGHVPVWKHEVLITGYLSFDDKKETFVNMAFAEDVRNKCVPNTNVTAWMPLPKAYREVEE